MFLVRYVLLILTVISPEFLLAGTPRVEQQVLRDVGHWQALQQTTLEIENRGLVDVVTVGGDPACDFNMGGQRLQDAIDSGAVEVRVANNHVYQENLVIDGSSVIVRGGFKDCTAAVANEQDFFNIVQIDGSAAVAPVLRIDNTAKERELIRLENLAFVAGTNSGVPYGGGISMELARVDLQLVRVIISNNTAQFGGGIGVDAGVGISNVDTVIIGQDVIISNNQANVIGGGMFCAFGTEVVFFGMSTIFGNEAQRGGGVFSRNGCDISFYSEQLPGQLVSFAGIVNNDATQEGGGVYMVLGSELYLFGQQMCADDVCLGDGGVPILVWMNAADSDALGNEDGGAIYIVDSNFPTRFFANGTVFEDNSAGGNGGAAFVSRNGEFRVQRSQKTCWNKDRCNYFLNNRSGQAVGLGGAIYNDGAMVDIANTYFEENRADLGTAIYSNGEDAVTRIEGGVFNDNGDNGQDGYSDAFVLSAAVGAELTVIHSTLADNDAEIAVINVDPAFDSSLNLQSSIIHDPTSGPVLSPVSTNTTIRCLLAHENGSFAGDEITVDDPVFIDRAVGDFRLDAQVSPAVDYCDDTTVDIQHPDINLQLRGWDDPDQVNGAGPFDLGANETYDNDIIFVDGFDG